MFIVPDPKKPALRQERHVAKNTRLRRSGQISWFCEAINISSLRDEAKADVPAEAQTA
jgi:hypothetical protein